MFLLSPVLAGSFFFTTGTTWEALVAKDQNELALALSGTHKLVEKIGNKIKHGHSLCLLNINLKAYKSD